MSILIDILGWSHFLVSAFCLVFGLLILLSKKGTSIHSTRGRIYVFAMIFVNVTALCIYRVDVFFFPHWLAIATLIVILLGYWMAAKKPIRRWKGLHIFCMVLSYYMLVGGGINEAFLHLEYFQKLVESEGPQVLTNFHLAAMLFFVVLLIVFFVRHKARANKELIS